VCRKAPVYSTFKVMTKGAPDRLGEVLKKFNNTQPNAQVDRLRADSHPIIQRSDRDRKKATIYEAYTSSLSVLQVCVAPAIRVADVWVA
jgi:hypothetical protein